MNKLKILILISILVLPAWLFGQTIEKAEIIEVNDIRNTTEKEEVITDLDVVFRTNNFGTGYEHRIYIVKDSYGDFTTEEAVLLDDNHYKSVTVNSGEPLTVNLDYMLDVEGDEVRANVVVVTDELVNPPYYKIYILTIENGTGAKSLSMPSNTFQIQFIATISPGPNITALFNNYVDAYQTFRIYADQGTYNQNVSFAHSTSHLKPIIYFESLYGPENTTISGAANNLPVITINSCHSHAFETVTIKGFTVKNGINNVMGAGGIGIFGAENVFLENLIIRNNQGMEGGGIGAPNYSCSESSFVYEKIFIRNTLIYNNVANDMGGGIGDFFAKEIYIDNSTIVNNVGNYSIAGTGGIHFSSMLEECTINNSIISDNSGYQINMYNSLIVNNSFIEDGEDGILMFIGSYTLNSVLAGTSTFTPGFADAYNNDYHLSYTNNSPCIDAGNNLYVPEELYYDLEGNIRKYGSSVDMGCYENFDEPTNVYDYTVDTEPKCPGEDIPHNLSDSDNGATYSVILDGEFQYNVDGYGLELDWAYTNFPGTYELWAYWGSPQAIQMNGTWNVTTLSLPQTDLTLDGSTVCRGEDATVTIFNTEADITYTLQEYPNSTQTTSGDDIIFTFSTQETEPGTYNLHVNATNNCETNVLDNTATLTVNPLPNTNLEVQTNTLIPLGENTTISLMNSISGYTYDVLVNQIYVTTTTGNGAQVDITIPNTFFTSGQNTITFRIISELGCEATTGEIITICAAEGEALNMPVVNNNTILPDDTYLVADNIEVQENGTLTINLSNIQFAPEASIIVQPGGKLIINDGKLKGSCNNLWQGIVVTGDPRLPITTGYQGTIIMDAGTIENAETAIYAGEQEAYQCAGIVKIEKVNFINNIEGIKIKESMDDGLSGGANFQNYINNNVFITDQYLANIGENPLNFINLSNVHHILIQDNTFYNYNPESYNFLERGTGIRSLNSGLYCENNDFKKLTYGIRLPGTTSEAFASIENNTFIDNTYGILIDAVDNVEITQNSFHINKTITGEQAGIFAINNNTTFTIEENQFTGYLPSIYPHCGIYLEDNTASSTIYLNTFNNVIGIFSFDSPLMVFECNNFNNNNHTGIYALNGANRTQGSSSYAIGNKFNGTCNANSEFYSSPSVSYFYGPANIYYPECTNNYMFTTKNVNACLSHLGDGAVAGIETITTLDQQITETETLLNETLDGGQTEQTLTQIENAQPSEALQLRDILLTQSPYLSETVMEQTTISEEILPPVMLTQVLSENPQAAKSVIVLQALNNRQNQLPTPFIQMINEGTESISVVEELQAGITQMKTRKARLKSRRLLYLNQTSEIENAEEEIIELLESDQSQEGKQQLFIHYISKGNYEQAQAVYNQMNPSQSLQQIFAIQLQLTENNLTYLDMTREQFTQIEQISLENSTQAGAIARNIKMYLTGEEHHYTMRQPQPQGMDFVPPPQMPELNFEISPNPAEDYFVADYKLPVFNFTTAEFKMYNAKNEEVYNQSLAYPELQILVETRGFEPGLYYCKLITDGKEEATETVIIKPGEITTGQYITIRTTDRNYNPDIEQNKITIYPNPASDEITINLKNSALSIRQFTLTICDNTGKEVYNKQYTSIPEGINKQLKIDVTNLQSGNYSVQLISEGKIIAVEKFIVE